MDFYECGKSYKKGTRGHVGGGVIARCAACCRGRRSTFSEVMVKLILECKNPGGQGAWEGETRIFLLE